MSAIKNICKLLGISEEDFMNALCETINMNMPSIVGNMVRDLGERLAELEEYNREKNESA